MKRLFVSLGVGLLFGGFGLMMTMLAAFDHVIVLVLALVCGTLGFMAGWKAKEEV